MTATSVVMVNATTITTTTSSTGECDGDDTCRHQCGQHAVHHTTPALTVTRISSGTWVAITWTNLTERRRRQRRGGERHDDTKGHQSISGTTAQTIAPAIEQSMAGPSSKDAQEQEQNITPAPLASAGERGKSLISEEHYAITGGVRRHGGDQRHGGEGQDDHSATLSMSRAMSLCLRTACDDLERMVRQGPLQRFCLTPQRASRRSIR
jgi:hypothetical protein